MQQLHFWIEIIGGKGSTLLDWRGWFIIGQRIYEKVKK